MKEPRGEDDNAVVREGITQTWESGKEFIADE